MNRSVACFGILLLLPVCLLAQQGGANSAPTPVENRGPYFEKPQGYTQEHIVTPTAPEDNIPRQIGGFFKDMFKSVRLSGLKGSYIGTELKVEPSEVKLGEHRDILVILSVFNKTGKLLKFEFPTSQRIEIVLRDSAGNLVERWSDDQAFAQVSSVVAVNPNERIEYRERISTRDMKPGQKYTVEATLINYPEHSKSVAITTK